MVSMGADELRGAERGVRPTQSLNPRLRASTLAAPALTLWSISLRHRRGEEIRWSRQCGRRRRSRKTEPALKTRLRFVRPVDYPVDDQRLPEGEAVDPHPNKQGIRRDEAPAGHRLRADARAEFGNPARAVVADKAIVNVRDVPTSQRRLRIRTHRRGEVWA